MQPHKNPYKLIVLALLMWPGLFLQAQQIETTKIQINTHASEIAPFVHDSMLYFISNRKNSVLVNVFDQEMEHLYNLYRAPILKKGKIGKASLFQPVQSTMLPSGPVAFSPNGLFHIVTLNKVENLRNARISKREIPLGLFESRQLPGNKWDTYVPIPFSNNSEFSFGQPAISNDGKTIFFVSNKDGGYGKTDIYMSTRTPEGWSAPVNLGNTINTPGRELFPFYHASGKLYFATDGHEGLGGLDIFYSTQLNNEWTTPVRLEAPINSVYDDFSCYIFPNETSGYFASNRDGSDNIYHFNYKIEFCENAEEVVEENYCFTFFEETAEALATETLKYRWEFSDGHVAEGIEVDHCLPGPGIYHINLNVIDAVTGEQQYNVASYDLPLERPQQVYFSLSETIKVNQPLIIKAMLTGFDDAENIQYFWDLGEKEKQIGETISHIFRKKGKYTIRCEAYWGENQKICSYRNIIVE